MLAQYSSSDSGAGGVLFVYLLFLLGLAFIPAVIASNKGRSGVGFYFFGLFCLFLFLLRAHQHTAYAIGSEKTIIDAHA